MRLGSPNAIAAGVSNCSSRWERGLSQHREIDMFKPVNVVSLVGRQGEMRSTMPWTNSKPESKSSIAREAAARAVRELFRVCELPDTSNPEGLSRGGNRDNCEISRRNVRTGLRADQWIAES